MPCFIRLIRRLRIPMPKRVSLFRDAERIEVKLKRRLGVEKHEELANRLKTMPEDTVRELFEAVLDEVETEKMMDSPDRLKEAKRRAMEILRVA